MSLPERLAALASADAYPHPCGPIEVVETHISWVILTGELAYKVKKPVRFPFVDFSTLERRLFFCREEVRCNRRFAPELYLGVVSVARLVNGGLAVEGDGEPVEWAVKMRQFPPEQQLDRVLERDGLDSGLLFEFGRTLAGQHAALPVHRGTADELRERVLEPVRDNFDDLERLGWTDRHRALLERGRAAMEALAQRHHELLVRRLEEGWIRECHGDLHLSNLVLLDGAVTPFDCLEFNAALRWIDVESDVAFLFMDCLVRERADLGYAFVDGYLGAAGDYEGICLLPFYAGYRAMVRAKVAALRREQADAEAAQCLEQRMLQYAEWSADWQQRPPGRLVLMCGLSGSGKSYLAERLAPRLPALRLRSDIARKRLAGLALLDRAHAPVGEGLYRDDTTAVVYRRLAGLAKDLLRSGENVIVDATFLEASWRAPFLALADELGTAVRIVHCDAPRDVLAERIEARARAGGDPSDADLAVLERQQQRFEPPRDRSVRFATDRPVGDAELERLAERLRSRV